jgi:hypothetical protein
LNVTLKINFYFTFLFTSQFFFGKQLNIIGLLVGPLESV